MELKLFWYPGTCARVPLIALEEIGEPFELHAVDAEAGEKQSAEYRSMNPKGKVPVLLADGHPLTENPAIQTFLARSYPEAQLLPLDDRWAETDGLSTMSWFAAGVHPHITRFRFPRMFADDPAAQASIRAAAGHQLEEAFGILEDRLSDREWLYSDWTIIDAYMNWLWFRATGSGMDGRQFSRCAEHAQRIEQRPSVARALDREELEMARIESIHEPPDWMPPYRAGRSPVVALG